MGRICPTCQSTNKHQKQEHNFSQPPFFELRSTLEIHWLKNKNRSVLPLPRTDHLCGLQAQPPSLLSYSLNYLKGTFSLNPLRTPQINIPHQQSSPPLLYSPPSPSEEPHHSLQHTAGGGHTIPPQPPPPWRHGCEGRGGDTHTHTRTQNLGLFTRRSGAEFALFPGFQQEMLSRAHRTAVPGMQAALPDSACPRPPPACCCRPCLLLPVPCPFPACSLPAAAGRCQRAPRSAPTGSLPIPGCHPASPCPALQAGLGEGEPPPERLRMGNCLAEVEVHAGRVAERGQLVPKGFLAICGAAAGSLASNLTQHPAVLGFPGASSPGASSPGASVRPVIAGMVQQSFWQGTDSTRRLLSTEQLKVRKCLRQGIVHRPECTARDCYSRSY